MRIEEFFDQAYATTNRYWWKEEVRYSTAPADHPTSLITQLLLRAVRRRQPARMLDLGCGEGADAIRFARLGWTVDAVDISGEAIDKAMRFAYEVGCDVRFRTMNALDFEAAVGAYDVIVCNGVLHYVEDQQRLVAHMQAMTAPGGINAVSYWSSWTRVPAAHHIVPTFPADEAGLIEQLYDDWDFLLRYYERDKPETSHDDLGAHAHSYVKFLAEKLS